MATATSAFEILGPIMVGPSSSHTAGALRIAALARSLAPDAIMAARFGLYNSFARTYLGHGTDRALVAGLLGLECDDTHVRDSLELARKATQVEADVIVFCGVYFMAETAAILNPSKVVLIPDASAGCPMADMITGEQLRTLKAQHPGALAVCYVNSTA